MTSVPLLVRKTSHLRGVPNESLGARRPIRGNRNTFFKVGVKIPPPRPNSPVNERIDTPLDFALRLEWVEMDLFCYPSRISTLGFPPPPNRFAGLSGEYFTFGKTLSGFRLADK